MVTTGAYELLKAVKEPETQFYNNLNCITRCDLQALYNYQGITNYNHCPCRKLHVRQNVIMCVCAAARWVIKWLPISFFINNQYNLPRELL